TQAKLHKELLSSSRLEGRKKVPSLFSRIVEDTTDGSDATVRRALCGHRDISFIAVGPPIAISITIFLESNIFLLVPTGYLEWERMFQLVRTSKIASSRSKMLTRNDNIRVRSSFEFSLGAKGILKHLK
ncbi:hypothetical protein Taro_021906, partial [Colocasia esculenta]|nr:hypothetical protein [Colocasia esculenta]